MTAAAPAPGGSNWFKRFVLPGLAFKAVVIGGGYATGRELAEYFMPSGPWGGVAGMILAMIAWSLVCVVTFLFARLTNSADYRTFFKHLLGPFGVVFEIAYVLFVVLILAVFGAAAGAIGEAVFGWNKLVGALCLLVSITFFATFGNALVERLFKWVSIFLYGTYGLFVVFAFSKFGDKILGAFSAPAPPTENANWAAGGLTYAGYNIFAAVVILPMLRHLNSNRDAVKAGLIAGPLAMIPALLFFTCMCAFYPAIAGETLPSDFMLKQMDLPIFHVAFQVMIFTALLEGGAGLVHAINERVAGAWKARRDRDLKNTRGWPSPWSFWSARCFWPTASAS